MFAEEATGEARGVTVPGASVFPADGVPWTGEVLMSRGPQPTIVVSMSISENKTPNFIFASLVSVVASQAACTTEHVAVLSFGPRFLGQEQVPLDSLCLDSLEQLIKPIGDLDHPSTASESGRIRSSDRTRSVAGLHQTNLTSHYGSKVEEELAVEHLPHRG